MFLFALLVWPIVIVVLFRRLSLPAALCWSLIAGYLLLPVGNAFDLPLLPAYTKTTMPAMVAGVMCFLIASSAPMKRTLRGMSIAQASQSPAGISVRDGRPRAANPTVEALLAAANRNHSRIVLLCLGAVLVLVPIGTAMTNSDTLVYGSRVLSKIRPYDAASIAMSAILSVLPFLLARRYLATSEAQTILLKVLILSGLGYAVLALIEVRLSPQLNIWIYGFFPHSFAQHIRAGGFRPVVFLEHGLELGIFFAICILAAATLWRSAPAASAFRAGHSRSQGRDAPREPSRSSGRGRWLVALVFLLVTLYLSKTLGAFAITLLLLPVALFLRPRLQVLIAAILGGIILFYPMVRGAGFVPTNFIVEKATMVDPARASSLNFRFENEDRLLNHASERPLLGWGGRGRHRVFDPTTGEGLSVTDGTWVIIIGTDGWIGYLAQFGLLTWPLFWAWRHKTLRDDPLVAGMTLVLVANLVDLIPNSSLLPFTWLLAGSLTGRLEAAASVDPAKTATPRRRAPAPAIRGRPTTAAPRGRPPPLSTS